MHYYFISATACSLSLTLSKCH